MIELKGSLSVVVGRLIKLSRPLFLLFLSLLPLLSMTATRVRLTANSGDGLKSTDGVRRLCTLSDDVL